MAEKGREMIECQYTHEVVPARALSERLLESMSDRDENLSQIYEDR